MVSWNTKTWRSSRSSWDSTQSQVWSKSLHMDSILCNPVFSTSFFGLAWFEHLQYGKAKFEVLFKHIHKLHTCNLNEVYNFFIFLQDMSLGIVWLICAFLFWTLTAIGLIFDKHPYAWPNEILRCGLILCLFTIFDITWKEFCVTNYYLTIIYSISLAVATSAMIFYPNVEEKAKTQ